MWIEVVLAVKVALAPEILHVRLGSASLGVPALIQTQQEGNNNLGENEALPVGTAHFTGRQG